MRPTSRRRSPFSRSANSFAAVSGLGSLRLRPQLRRTISLGRIGLPGPVIGTEGRQARKYRRLTTFRHLVLDRGAAAAAEELDVHSEEVAEEHHPQGAVSDDAAQHVE